MTKRCSSCYRVLDLNQFWRNVARPDGHQNWCKACVRAWKFSNREIEREAERARRARPSGGPPAIAVSG